MNKEIIKNEIIEEKKFLINVNSEVEFDECAILITDRHFGHGGVGK